MNTPVANDRADPYFACARQGLPMDPPVLDAHGHLGPGPALFMPGASAEKLISSMDRCGVRALAISSNLSIGADWKAGNRLVAHAADAFPGRFIGYAVINPNYPREENEAELEHWLGSHLWFRGIKLHPVLHNYPLSGDGYRIAFEVAARYGVPLLTHTWGEGPDAQLCSPALLGPLAERYPAVPILVGHSGGCPRGYRLAIETALQHPNVYLETCGSFQAMGLIELLVESVSADKVVFGSDACWLSQGAGLARVVYAKISGQDKAKVLCENAAKLLRYEMST